jgi:predicted dinucleotide-binding enzyme
MSRRIAVIGSGTLGATLARNFVAMGHEVAIANRRGPASIAPLRRELGCALHPMRAAAAAHFGEVVVLATPFRTAITFPERLFAERVVVDATNCFAQRDGAWPPLERGLSTSSELIAAHLGDARVVKAFNTMSYATLASRGDLWLELDDRLAVFVASDEHDDALAAVERLIENMGFASINTGRLAESRDQQPGGALFGVELTRRAAVVALDTVRA